LVDAFGDELAIDAADGSTCVGVTWRGREAGPPDDVLNDGELVKYVEFCHGRPDAPKLAVPLGTLHTVNDTASLPLGDTGSDLVEPSSAERLTPLPLRRLSGQWPPFAHIWLTSRPSTSGRLAVPAGGFRPLVRDSGRSESPGIGEYMDGSSGGTATKKASCTKVEMLWKALPGTDPNEANGSTGPLPPPVGLSFEREGLDCGIVGIPAEMGVGHLPSCGLPASGETLKKVAHREDERPNRISSVNDNRKVRNTSKRVARRLRFDEIVVRNGDVILFGLLGAAPTLDGDAHYLLGMRTAGDNVDSCMIHSAHSNPYFESQ
jgi:hypothetical protein